MDKTFLKMIEKSGYLHRPLKDNRLQSFENNYKEVEILDEYILFSPDKQDLQWFHQGRGDLYKNKNNEYVLSSKQVYPSWPEGAPDDGDYTNYGVISACISLEKMNMENYNRIYFEVRPECDGMVNPHIMLSVKNDGHIKIPDLYNREGYHTVNLMNRQWNCCFVEITDLPRDVINELSFSILINGKDRATLDDMKMIIRKIVLQKAKKTNVSKGWYPQEEEIIFSHNGYHSNHPKIAILKNCTQEYFQLIDSQTKEAVLTGKVKTVDTYIGQYSLLDFSTFKQIGQYQLRVGKQESKTFKIDSFIHRYNESVYRTLNFVYLERCGCPIPDTHSSCHEDIIAIHNGQTIIFNGGWHDAGDVSQQLVQTAELSLALFEMSKAQKNKDEQLSLRLLEEAEWGFDFILKTRFGDGYRATSAGITRWTDCKIGNMDDAIARVHNNAYENFILSGIEGNIALCMDDNNRLKAKTIKIAIEDYEFAYEKFQTDNFKHEPIFWEHTYNMSDSLFLATMVWSSCILYQLTHHQVYAKNAEIWADSLLECQESQGLELYTKKKIKGFFYRDSKHLVIQHFNHQAREHMYAKALDLLIESHVCEEKNSLYRQRMKDYGEYLKFLMEYTYPYPMIASGLYLKNENLDEESFNRQHLLVGEEAKSDYVKQLESGHQIGKDLYIRKFPVWFSFKGNNGIILSMGKSASLLARRLKDRRLLEIAEGQLQWMLGMNPFGQSLIYGEGYNYAQQYSVQTGEMIGEIPVGIQTFENEDEPYWSQFTNATYKEVWVGLVGKWMDILIDLYKVEEER